jgi:hypothetical protein
MSEPLSGRLKDFACRLLNRRGALVDWPETAQEGWAMLPAEVAAALHCMEILPLSPQPSSPLPLNLSSDFLDRIEPLLAAEPAVVRLRLPSAYLKQSDLPALVARTFTWPNARVRVQQTLPVQVEYHTWFFAAVLDSADRWEDLVKVTINASSGAEVPWGDPFRHELLQFQEAEPGPEGASATLTLRQAARCALGGVREDSRTFVSRVEARLDRDRRRLNEYYGALLREDRRRASRHVRPPDPEQQKARSQAVRLELQRKLAELQERYAFRLTLSPLAVVQLDCPALAVDCHVLRKTASQTHRLFWNALGKGLEPLACRRCGKSTFTLMFTDEQVESLCTACHG